MSDNDEVNRILRRLDRQLKQNDLAALWFLGRAHRDLLALNLPRDEDSSESVDIVPAKFLIDRLRTLKTLTVDEIREFHADLDQGRHVVDAYRRREGGYSDPSEWDDDRTKRAYQLGRERSLTPEEEEYALAARDAFYGIKSND